MKKRHKDISMRKPEGTASIRHQLMNQNYVAKYFRALKEVFDEYKLERFPKRIWNMDETGMVLEHKPSKILARRGSKHLHSRTSGNRELITVIATVNPAGEALPPHMVVKGKTKRVLEGFDTQSAPAGTNMSASNSGWTKQGIASLWFQYSFIPNIGPDRPQILIFDGHDSHGFVEIIEQAIAENIILVELPAHTSHWLQPLDRSVFFPLKTYFNEACQEEFMIEFPSMIV